MTRNVPALMALAATTALFGWFQTPAFAQHGGSPTAGTGSDAIITQPTIYYPGWTVSWSQSGFLNDAEGDWVGTCGTSTGNPSVSFSASLTYVFQNATGSSGTNTIAVTMSAGGTVAQPTSNYYAASTLTYSSGTAYGSAPWGAANASYSDVTYEVDTTIVTADGYTATYDGSASGSASDSS